MTSLPGRQQAVVLIEEAESNGARLIKACALLNLSVRTYQRWSSDSAVSADRRTPAPRLDTNTINSQQRSARRCAIKQNVKAACLPLSVLTSQVKTVI